MKIRNATTQDAPAIAGIYNYYVANSIATFETEPVTAQAMSERIGESGGPAAPWLVAEIDDEVVGYAYTSRWKGRCAYRYSVESTIYIHPDKLAQGIGKPLYRELLTRLSEGTTHVVIAGISLPNDASVALHEKLGFRKIGQFEEVGFKFDQWIDVGYWQLTLGLSSQ